MPHAKVAALYDIHGNLSALEAVLAEVEEAGVDAIVIGGDVVPGPVPEGALERLRELTVPTSFIHGNGERDVVAFHEGRSPERVPLQFHEAMRWVADAMSAGSLAEVGGWPASATLPVEGIGDVLFCHATPRDDNEIFTRLTPEERLAPVFEGIDAALVVCGHTHMQFDRDVGGTRVVNAGSVGMPFGEPGAYWLLLGPDVELRRTSYDVEAARRGMLSTGYPGAGVFDPARPPSEEDMLKAFEAAALR